MSGITYDTGALIGAERSDRRMWALHRRALQRGLSPTVPAGVLAQSWRGGPQPQLSRLLAGCRTEALDDARARSAGNACSAAGTSDTVDAAVVVGAACRRDLIVTSDPDDLHHLCDALAVTVDIRAI